MSKIHSNQRVNYLLMEEKKGIKKSKNPKMLIDYSQTDDVYDNFKDYNLTKIKKSVYSV